MKIKARIYGNINRAGAVVNFEVVNTLPETGEPIDMQDPDWIWSRFEKVHLDPEQRTGDDDEHANYTLFEGIQKNLDTGEEYTGYYFAVPKKGEYTEIEELARKIRESGEWIPELLEELCEHAGMLAEWQAADGSNFEDVAFAAAEKLGVEIL